MGTNPVSQHQPAQLVSTTVHHNLGQPAVVQQDIYRPPTPTRIRISANDSQPVSLTAEIQGLRNKVHELETENSRLKSKLNGASQDVMNLQAEVERLKSNELSLRVQAERLEKQRKTLEVASDLNDNFKMIKSEILKMAEEIRKTSPNWFVSLESNIA